MSGENAQTDKPLSRTTRDFRTGPPRGAGHSSQFHCLTRLRAEPVRKSHVSGANAVNGHRPFSDNLRAARAVSSPTALVDSVLISASRTAIPYISFVDEAPHRTVNRVRM